MKPILCVIDIQKEYNTPGRDFYIQNIEESLKNAMNVLNHARKNNWEVVHIKHLQEGKIFSPENSYSEFIEGFEPITGELKCIKDNFSSFSSSSFTQFLENKKEAEIYIIGYGSTMCCLSTIIDGYHRGYKFTYISDASNAKPTSEMTSVELHNAAVEIIKTYSKVINSKNL